MFHSCPSITKDNQSTSFKKSEWLQIRFCHGLALKFFFFGSLPYLPHSYFQHLPNIALWLALWYDIYSAILLRRLLQKMYMFTNKDEMLHLFRKISVKHWFTIFISGILFSNFFILKYFFFFFFFCQTSLLPLPLFLL